MSTFIHPAQLQPARFNGSYHTGSQPQTPNGVPMVHTPYSCAHDLVPEGSEEASQIDTFSSDYSNFSPRHSASPPTEHFYPHQQQQQQMRSISPQPNGGTFDTWTCQYEADPASSPIHQQQQQSFGHSLDSTTSNSSWSRTSSYRQQQQQPQASRQATTAPTGQGNQPYPAFMNHAPIVNVPVHAAHLKGKAEYLEMPPGAEITQGAQWHRFHKVFIGHIKFEINASGLRWLILMLTGVHAGKVEVRGMGCFMVFFGSAEEVFLVRGLHNRVLFDTHGVWFAKSLVQEEALHPYATQVAPNVHAKLPKGLMVVDEETSRRRTRRVKTATATGGDSKPRYVAYNGGAPVTPNATQTTGSAGDYDQQQQQSGFQSNATCVAQQQEQQQLSAQEMWSAAQFDPHVRAEEYCS